MKSIEGLLRVFVLVGAIALFAAGCTGNSDGADGADPAGPTSVADDVSAGTTAPSATAQPADEPAPTATAAPASITDEDRIAAAIAGLDRDGTSDLIAWDILDTMVRDDGDVTLTICGWTGDTVFDKVYSSIWKIDTGGAQVAATEINTFPTAGECLNTQLIESALATIEDFGEYWQGVLEDPAKFRADPRTKEILAPTFFPVASSLTDQWLEDELSHRGSGIGRILSDAGAANDPLYRRFRSPDGQHLEIVTCRPMDETYGVYRGEVLLNNNRPADGGGPHQVDSVELTLDPVTGRWQASGSVALVWSDCVGVDSWVEAASAWRPDEADFRKLP